MTENAPEATGRPDDIKAVPVRHPGRWISAAVAAIVATSVLWSFLNNPRAQWDVFSYWFLDPQILDGVVLTIELTLGSMLIGVVIGVVMAVMRLSPNPVLKSVSWLYIWFFRGIPRLVLLVLLFSISALYPKITFGVPYGGEALFAGNANAVLTGIVVAYVGLGLSEGAYMAEIVRAGLLSVDEGQREAASSLGLSPFQTLRQVILPQAMRVVLPPTGNETISMIKDTALVVVLGNILDLFTVVQRTYQKNYKVIPLLLVATAWYLILTSILYVGQYYLERRYGRGSARELPPTPRQKLMAMYRKWRPQVERASA